MSVSKPTALVQVSEELHLDPSRSPQVWRRDDGLSAGRRAERARCPPTPAIIERSVRGRSTEGSVPSIRSRRGFVAGEPRGDRPRSLEGEPRFELRFPRGTLELAYSRTSYEEAQARRAEDLFLPRDLAVDVRWNGASIALPHASELEWHGAELVEMVIVATAMIDDRPSELVPLFESVPHRSGR
jgi:hypothetical protein